VGASGLCRMADGWRIMRSRRFIPLEAERSAQRRFADRLCGATQRHVPPCLKPEFWPFEFMCTCCFGTEPSLLLLNCRWL
jgi:hypothetical protein